MIDSIGRVMLYVKDPRKVADFWVQKLGFAELGEQPAPDNTVAVEVAPTKQSDTSFVLYSRDAIEKYQPELTLGIPSILLSCHNLEATHKDFIKKGIPAGDIVVMQGMKTFNFPDNEGNYFAVREVP